MQIIYDPGFNFHNAKPIRVRIKKTFQGMDGLRGLLSPRQADRIAKHFCGVTDCRCNSGGIQSENEYDTEFSIAISKAEGS